MTRNGWLLAAWIGLGLISAASAFGDEFDRIEGPALVAVPQSKDAKAHQTLTVGAIEGLPNVLKETRSALIAVTTDQGNFARMLVVPAFRKSPGGQGKPVPVLLIERFDTFDAGNINTRLARGKDVILFDGFQLDLDGGQIVPEGQGGDIQFLTKGEGGPRLTALGKTRLYTFTKPLVSKEPGAGRPSIGRGVLPSDFNGRYRLFANGQWSGTMDLKVDDDGVASGRFRSDLNGASYPVTGKVAADVPHKIAFAIKFPRTHQDYDGLLWTEGKGAMAGTLIMNERAYGFFALREGGEFAPAGEDIGPVPKGSNLPGRRAVTFRKGQYTLDGKAMTDQELTDALKKAVAADPASWVLLRVAADETYAEVERAIEVISASGVGSIRFAAAGEAE